jgi:hypothetical protein
MLARVDGKSPVEYIDAETEQLLRNCSRAAIANGIGSVDAMIDRLAEVAP